MSAREKKDHEKVAQLRYFVARQYAAVSSWHCVHTTAVVGVVRVHFVSGSAGADEAGAGQVGALLLTQLLFTGVIIAEVCRWTRHSEENFHQLSVSRHFNSVNHVYQSSDNPKKLLHYACFFFFFFKL